MDIKMYLQAPVPRWLALVAVVGTGAASAGSVYLTMKRKYEQSLDEMVRQEVARSEKFLSIISTKQYASPIEAAEALEVAEGVDDIIESQSYTSTDESGDRVEVARNVFTDMKEVGEELEQLDVEKRDPEHPYIITFDEFFASEQQMVTLTWFEGDEVLADEKDEHIPDINRVVGEDNLLRFGYGSNDPNIVYIRNEKMEIDFEVVKNEGKYTEQVLGFIQHEEKVGPRKFRTYDD